MSSLWLQFPDSFEMCKRCVGSGKVRCSRCLGSGGRYENRYDRDYEGRSISRSEWVSCSSCSGTGNGMCISCGGSGGIQKSSTKGSGPQPEADSRQPVDSYEPGEPDEPTEQSVGSLVSRFSELVDHVQEVLKHSRIPSSLKTTWAKRLHGFSSEFMLLSFQFGNAPRVVELFIKPLAAKIEGFHEEVKIARLECMRNADRWNPSNWMQDDYDFRILGYRIRDLEEFLAEFGSKLP